MSKAALGMAMMVVGAGAILVGVVMYLSPGDGPPAHTVPTAAETPTATVIPTTDVSMAVGEDPGTSVATTTAGTASTSGSAGVPTTSSTSTLVLAETLDAFVAAFAGATEADDFDFVWSRLHPAVIERADGDEGLCREWVEREILALDDYRLVEVVDGPSPLGEIPDVFTAAISFTLEGETFEGIGQYAVVDGLFTWLGQCR